MRRPKGILFDLDDTLLDRRASIQRYSAHFAHDFADRLLTVSVEDVRAIIQAEDGYGYRPRPDFFASLCNTIPWDKRPLPDLLETHWNRVFLHDCSILRDGAERVLETLRNAGMLLGIVTNGGAHNQNAKIDACGLRERVHTVVVSDEVGMRKPDRRIFELAVGRLGISAKDAWYVGDSPEKDVLGAAQADLMPVWIRAQFPWPPDTPFFPLQIATLDELVGLLSNAS